MPANDDLTVVYYTANQTNEHFFKNVQDQIKKSFNGRIISISHKPIDFGDNTVVSINPSHINIYRQALMGAKKAKTKYIAMAEDDILYSPEHFKYRPKPGVFAYNVAYWNFYTWEPTLFSYKGRRNMFGLICERDLFIEAMEERFAKHPMGTNPAIWAEPSKYERQLGVTVRSSEEFYTNPCNIMFSHEKALSYGNLGRRKKLGNMRAYDVEYWGTPADVMKLYDPRLHHIVE